MSSRSSFVARALREQRAREREERARMKAMLTAHARGRQATADALNAELAQVVKALNGLLGQALSAAPRIDFETLKKRPERKPFDPGDLSVVAPAPTLDHYMPVAPTFFQSLVPGTKKAYERACELGLQQYDADAKANAEAEATRVDALRAAKQAYEAQCEQEQRSADAWNAEVDKFAADYKSADPQAVGDYCRMVLEASDYPAGFPKLAKTAFVPDSKQLVVEYEFPGLEVVPEIANYKYVKTKDEITSTARPANQRRTQYGSVVAQATLRTLHELFVADAGHIETIVFNGYVTAVDKATGKTVRPCLMTIRVSRDAFAEINLAQVDPTACLKRLNASVSPSPTELVGVRPVLEFDMVDRRFVPEMEILPTLDQRPNLMELSPIEFESLISNLFEQMGLETRVTQASRDGGVDCVAYDPRPILGGKVIIQAKRYKNTVGVSAVRDLFGTLQNEGASKGILVTTSGYGKAAFEFADGKPIELLSGSNLLYLLEQHAGVKAKIEPPDDWKDPVSDAPEVTT
jgi:restriction system protein